MIQMMKISCITTEMPGRFSTVSMSQICSYIMHKTEFVLFPNLYSTIHARYIKQNLTSKAVFSPALMPTVRRRARTRLLTEEEDAETPCNSISSCLILSTRLQACRWAESVETKCWETLRGRECGVMLALARRFHLWLITHWLLSANRLD